MQQSFMVQDIRNLLLAVPLFLPYLFLPGYAAGFVLNIFAFRTQSLRIRVALSLALSFAILPITANLLARVVSVRACALILLVASVAAAAGCVLFKARRGSSALRRAGSHRRVRSTLVAVLTAAWLLVCLVSFPDLQLGHRIWNSVLIYDGGLRAAFIDAVLRTGVPPHNPLCFFGLPIPSRYYYYWSTVCALPAALGHLPARSVLAASSFWSGLGLAATLCLFLRFFLGVRVRLQRFALIGTVLFAVTGLDLIPTAISWCMQGFVRADMEWWDGTEIPSWIDSTLWTPHHIAGLLCCLTGLLLLWPVSARGLPARGATDQPTKALNPGEAAAHIGLAALAFASAAGLSVYLAFCFGLFLAIWVLRLLGLRAFRAAVPFLAACLLALLLSVPLLYDLHVPAAQQLDTRSGRRAHLITTGLRTSGWVKANLHHLHLWHLPLLVVDMATTYILEFGFFLLVLGLVVPHLWRRRNILSQAQIALCYLLGTAFFVTTFLKSEAIQSNDLGMRAPLLAQWVLLLWAIPLLDGMVLRKHTATRRGSLLLSATLLLGFCASLYQLALLRLAAPLDAAAAHSNHLPIAALPVSIDSHDVYQITRAEASLAPLLAPGTVAAFNPFNEDRILLLANSHTQLAAVSPQNCGTPFGGSPADCDHTKAILRTIFADGAPAVAVSGLDDACRSAAVGVLLVQPSDPVWAVPNSWVWQRPALVANQALRAVRCGGPAKP